MVLCGCAIRVGDREHAVGAVLADRGSRNVVAKRLQRKKRELILQLLRARDVVVENYIVVACQLPQAMLGPEKAYSERLVPAIADPETGRR